MKKKIGIGVAVLVVVLIAAGVSFWYATQRPMYQPGALRSSAFLEPPAGPHDESFWTVEPGVRLRHFSDGTGKPVLVLHGGPGIPIQGPLVALKPLTRRYQFIYYDQRGCGKSARPIDKFSSANYYSNLKKLEGTLGIGAQLADIERIRRILGEDKLILLGHSFGAFLASLYAAEFPERVKGLVLVAPADVLVMPAGDGGLFERVRRLLPEGMKAEYAGFLERYLDYRRIFGKSEAELASLNAEFGKYYRAAVRPSASPLLEAGENGGWMVHAMYFSMGRRHDYRGALKSVWAPVLILHGEQDLQPEQASRTYEACFANGRFFVIRNAGHFLFDDQPEEFAAVTRKFLRELN